jgi:hypothetical protein
MTLLFLEMWNANRPTDTREAVAAYMPDPARSAAIRCGGLVQPYGDSPVDSEILAENVYLNVINQATDYVYIASPYVVIDYEMSRALSLAARRGVDVRLVVPAVPDKKIVYDRKIKGTVDVEGTREKKIRNLSDLTCTAVFYRQYCRVAFARNHRSICVLKVTEAHAQSRREYLFRCDRRKRTLGAAVCHAHSLHISMLIMTGQSHRFTQKSNVCLTHLAGLTVEVFRISADHLILPCRVENGKSTFLFMLCNELDRFHSSSEKLCHLAIDLVYYFSRLFKFVFHDYFSKSLYSSASALNAGSALSICSVVTQ